MENYFIVTRENNDSYPLLVFDGYEVSRQFKKFQPINLESPAQLSIGKPKPKKPVLVDYHTTPIPVFSKKIKNVLTPMNLFGSQLIDAEINLHGKKYAYWILNTFNQISCIDNKQSELKMISPMFIGEILKLVLDESVLEEIPREKRLLFRIKEYNATWIFEESVKDVIMLVNPVGLRFIHVDEWNSLVGFRR